MKIAIDLTSLYGRKITGVEIYGIDLYKILKKSQHTIIPIFHCQNTVDDNKNAYIIPACNRLWLENVEISRAIRRLKPDIALFPVFPPPLDLFYNCKTQIYQTIHDTVSFKYRETQNFAAKYYYLPKQKVALGKLNGIITISETVKKQLTKITDKEIYNCGNVIAPEYKSCYELASEKLIKQWGLCPNSYFISVSTIEPRKNFKYLMRVLKPILDERDMKLVLVGRKGWGKDEELQQLMEEIGSRLVFPGFVEFAQLVSLYHYAYAFALLSLDEGFGRTPFEAVACGCKRVILSDIEIFHETFGDNAFYLPLADEKSAKILLKESDIPLVKEDMKLPFDVLEERINKVFLPAIENIKDNVLKFNIY